MASFGKKSSERRETLHPDIQRILDEAIKVYDFSILEGLRSEEKQHAAFTAKPKTSNAEYPNSKHNRSKQDDGDWDYELSDAVDVAPYPIKWPNLKNQSTKEYVKRMGEFYRLAGIIQAVADRLKIKIKWGGDFSWKFDGPHFERVID